MSNFNGTKNRFSRVKMFRFEIFFFQINYMKIPTFLKHLIWEKSQPFGRAIRLNLVYGRNYYIFSLGGVFGFGFDLIGNLITELDSAGNLKRLLENSWTIDQI